MKTEELAQWVNSLVPLEGEYDEASDNSVLVAARLRDLQAEVERLKAQPTATAEQERNRVLRYLSNRACHLKITDSYEGSRALERAERAIEKGEHWLTEEKP